MRKSRQIILSAYYHATAPPRVVRNALLAARGRAPVCIGTFHRIADDDANAWTTSRGELRRAVEWLQSRFDLISLAEAQRRITAADNGRTAFVLTFDDGYAENCEWALPWLLERGVPFTYFVTSDPVLRGGYFQHDLAMGNRFPANTVAQLRELADHELVEIGGHTRTHANLGAIEHPQRLFDEVIRSSDELAQAVGRPVERFAFPFGQHANLNGQVFTMLAAHGFTAACSAYGGYNFAGGDVFHLQRMCCDGPAIKTKNFVTLDPYKQWTIPRYAYPTGVPTMNEPVSPSREVARE